MTELPIQRLLAIMARLRDPATGCPWDLAQSFESLAPFTLEEASEVVDVLERGDRAALREELGDLLFQVVFLSQLAQEEGDFDFQSVATAISDKLVRRHPHVFNAQPLGEDLSRNWEALKQQERSDRGQTGVLADVPLSLPALSRAAKLGRRAGRVGFDWPDAVGARSKVQEEFSELDVAIAQGDEAAMSEELGDLLLAVTSSRSPSSSLMAPAPGSGNLPAQGQRQVRRTVPRDGTPRGSPGTGPCGTDAGSLGGAVASGQGRHSGLIHAAGASLRLGSGACHT